MPELPEVETVVRGLSNYIVGKRIVELGELREKTIKLPAEFNVILLQKISEVRRRGKYIVICFQSDYLLIVHLRMTGKLIIANEKGDLSGHTRAYIVFDDSSRILFDDVRTFGTVEVISAGDEEYYFRNLGVEPLSDDFTVEYLRGKLHRRKTSIKNVLLDQKVIAGLGNIYVNEILHRVRVLPERAADSLSEEEIKEIVTKTGEVLRLAIECNGTSISDYRRIDDKKGSFQNFLEVYGKKVCCKGHQIKRVKTGGRSTFYCPECIREDDNCVADKD